MYFRHSAEIWRDYPELAAAAVYAEGIDADASVEPWIEKFGAAAQARLAVCAEGEFAQIQAWRRVFAKMGLKPTQYRCAAEALLRRFKKEGALPRLHPLIDVCNALSLAYAIPVAVFDLARISSWLEVRYAIGIESYLTFGGETEHPYTREVIFADAGQRAHARRWTNRQSGYSAVGEGTCKVLIVAEAMHASAAADIRALLDSLAQVMQTGWNIAPKSAILSGARPQFDF